MLPSRNMEQLHRLVLDRADPKSPNYAKWLKLDEINRLTRPEQRHFDTVINWLKSNGRSPFFFAWGRRHFLPTL